MYKKRIKFFASVLFGFGAMVNAAAQTTSASPAFTDVTVETRRLSEEFFREGQKLPLAQIRGIYIGQSADELRGFLGAPASQQGLHAWEYHLAIPLQDQRNYLVCQLMVRFDAATKRVSSAYWRRPQCEALARAATVGTTDILFDFSSYQLTPAAQRTLNETARTVKGVTQTYDVKVVGYTDRIGRPAANQALSRQRADTVKRYLVSRGVPENVIRVSGVGHRDAVVQCEGNHATPALIECLAPNRRVTVHTRPVH